MNLKKLAALWMAGVFVFSIVPMTTASVAFAAKGGARISAPKSAPAASKPSSNSSNAAKAASPNTKDYAPSKSAKDLNKEAPASKANTAAAQSSTGWGSALRSISIFAGGMMLGGLLGHMFGFGAGSLMSDMFGLLMNVVLLGVVLMALRMLWSWFRGRKNRGSDPYHQNFAASQQHRGNVTDIAAPQSRVQDIRPPQDGYDAKSMADRYRNR